MPPTENALWTPEMPAGMLVARLAQARLRGGNGLAAMSLIHGSCVAIGGHGVLIRGGSGSGKSDLALRLIDGGGELVADDYVELEGRDGGLVARAPEPLAGLIEVRGLGLLRLPSRAEAVLKLEIDLLGPAERLERLPDPAHRDICGYRLRTIRLAAFEPSAAAKVRFGLRTLLAGEDEMHAAR